MKTKNTLSPIIILIVALILYSFGLSAQNSKSILNDSLVAYYPFNGNANDESGNGNHGTVFGATLTYDRFGNPNSAYSFDGINDYIEAPADSLPTGERTISFWFYTTSVASHPVPFAYGGSSCGHTWFQSINQGMSENAYSLESHCEVNIFVCYYNQPPLNEWYHWVMTTSAEGTKMYINGELFCYNNNFVTNTTVTGKDLAIGVCVNVAGYAPYTDSNVGHFYGALDDFRIYNKELSADEVRELYGINRIDVDLKVFLEGPFNGTDMNNSLNPDDLPLAQPFNTPPWNYIGNESVVAIPDTGVVDWILIELRDTTDAQLATPATVTGRKAAFLMNDGSVVDMEGTSYPSVVSPPIVNNLYVVIWHRNHIGIMSANPLTESGGVYSYDFTTPAGQAYGTNAQKNLGGVYGMYAADGNADGTVNILDITETWSTDAGNSDYLNGDFDLNSQSDNKDKNDIWVGNVNKQTQVPD